MRLPETPHAYPVREIEEQLSTSPQGLTDDEAQARLRMYGWNILSEGKTSWLALLLQAGVRGNG